MESKKYLSKKELWMFAVGAGGQGMIYAMMSSYVSDYYVNVLQLRFSLSFFSCSSPECGTRSTTRSWA